MNRSGSERWYGTIESEKWLTREIFVSKVDEVDVVSESLTKVINNVLWIKWVKAKVIVRYVTNWLTNEEFDIASRTIFSEPPVDEIIDKENIIRSRKTITIEALSGQYDARVDALRQCLMLQTWNNNHQVRASTVVALEGEVSGEDLVRIKDWIINPVEKEETDINNIFLNKAHPTPEDVKNIEEFTELDDEWLKSVLQWYKLSINLADMKIVQEYFISRKRNPTVTEIKVIDTFWSDHCRHTTFTTHIVHLIVSWEFGLAQDIKETLRILNNQRESLWREGHLSLMEIATLYSRYLQAHPELNENIKNLVISDEVNACTFTTEIELEDWSKEVWEIQFKNETHNHPTEIEPFWWAATCLGWCIRDPMSWRTWVFQAMRISGSGDPTQAIDQTLAGKLSQRAISQIAALWYSSYGNQIWIHTGLVKNFFHPWYVAKHFECGFVIAWAPAQNIVRKKPKKGDKLFILGWSTGRDWIGGATGSSKTHDSTSVATMWAEVQKWNPVIERSLTRLFAYPQFASIVKRCNDFGAWGISVAAGEIAEWVTVDLDKMPTKYPWLNWTELALSESQERMLIVVDEKNKNLVHEYAKAHNVMAVEVGQVTTEEWGQNRFVITWRWQEIVSLDRDFLNTNWAQREIPEAIINEQKVDWNIIPESIDKLLKKKGLKAAFLANLKRLEVASQKWIWQIFDNSVWSSNVLAAYGGKYQVTPQSGMVSRIPQHNWVDSITTTISAPWFDPEVSSQSTYLGAMYAIIDSIVKTVVLWWHQEEAWLTLQEYFGKLGEDPARWGECTAWLLGAFRAQHEFTVPAIWGKDSMSWTFDIKPSRIDVPPTIVSFAVNKWNINNHVSAEFKNAWSNVYFIPVPKNSDWTPVWAVLRENLRQIHNLTQQNLIKAASVVGTWWIAASIAMMCLWNKVWFTFDSNIEERDLFTNQMWGILLELDPIHSRYMDQISGAVKVWLTSQLKKISFSDGDSVQLHNVLNAWTNPLEEIFPSKTRRVKETLIEPSEKARTTTKLVDRFWQSLSCNLLVTPPKVLVLTFPWTNSELDTFHAIRKAWMEPVEVIIKNHSEKDLIESTTELAKQLKACSMVVFPWGFSAWDEPDWSAKFITSVARMSIVRDALNEFFHRSDTLTLWICNWFQALVKLGVFNGWFIEDALTPSSPTLTFNAWGRGHITDHVGLSVRSVLSPLMSTVKIGDTFVIPVSHWEWRLFLRNAEDIQRYIANGQVILQYLDNEGKATSHYNWSLKGIAALCSPDGRILWLMPHPERTGHKLFQNIPWNHDLPLFEGAAQALGVKKKFII